MPNEHRPLKVFLCHAHSDKSTVRNLYQRLIKDGVDAWLDKENLLPGQDWEYEIRKSVREADVVVVCLSKQFSQAGFRQKEVRLALDTAMEKNEGEIFIIPARLDECDNLESLRRWHWVDLFEDDGYEMLMRALRARAHKIGAALQAKRNWLPTVTAPLKSGKPDFEKKPGEAKPVPPIMEGKGSQAVKPKIEEPKLLKPSTQRKPNIAIVVAFTGLAGTIIAVLLSLPLIERMFSPVPSPTEMVTATPTSMLQPVSKTPMPSLTPAKTLTSTPTPRAITGDTIDKITLLGKIVPSENERFTSADVAPNGEIIAVSLYNGKSSSVQLWRTDDSSLLKPLDTLDLYITNILFSPDGNLLAAGAKDGTLKIWMVKTGKQIQSLKDTTATIEHLGFSKDSRKLVASTSSRVEVWDIETGSQLSAINVTSNTSRPIASFAVSSNNKIAYITSEYYIYGWHYEYPLDPKRNKPYKTPIAVDDWTTRYITNYGNIDDLQHMQQVSDTGFVEVLDFSQNDEMLLGRNGGQISIINLNNNNEVTSFPYSVGHGVFSPDNRSIVISGYQELFLLRISDNKVERIPSEHKKPITSLAFSRNGWILISGSDDSVDIWGILRWNSTPTPTMAPPTAIQ